MTNEVEIQLSKTRHVMRLRQFNLPTLVCRSSRTDFLTPLLAFFDLDSQHAHPSSLPREAAGPRRIHQQQDHPRPHQAESLREVRATEVRPSSRCFGSTTVIAYRSTLIFRSTDKHSDILPETPRSLSEYAHKRNCSCRRCIATPGRPRYRIDV